MRRPASTAEVVELVPAFLHPLVRVVECPHEVALEIPATRAEVAGELAVGLDEVLGEGAEVVARERVAIAVAEAAPVLGGDMRNTVLGPDDIGGVAQRRFRWFRVGGSDRAVGIVVITTGL